MSPPAGDDSFGLNHLPVSGRSFEKLRSGQFNVRVFSRGCSVRPDSNPNEPRVTGLLSCAIFGPFGASPRSGSGSVSQLLPRG